MNIGHVRYDQNSEPSKTVKVRDVRTPDPYRSSLPSELPTYIGTPDKPTREHQEIYRGWANIGYVRYCHTSKKQVSSFVSQTLKTHMGWLEHL